MGSLCAGGVGGGGGGGAAVAVAGIVGVTAVGVGGSGILLDLLLMGGVKVERIEAEADSFTFFLCRGVGMINVSRLGTSTTDIESTHQRN